jgi:hypothetical protein
MAPADLRKEGSAYDLTLTLEPGASEQIKAIDIDISLWASCRSMAAYSHTRGITYRHQS